MVTKMKDSVVLNTDAEMSVTRRTAGGIAGMLVLSVAGQEILLTNRTKGKTALEMKTEFDKAIYAYKKDGEDAFTNLRTAFYEQNWDALRAQLEQRFTFPDGFQKDTFIAKIVEAELNYAKSQEKKVDPASLTPRKVNVTDRELQLSGDFFVKLTLPDGRSCNVHIDNVSRIMEATSQKKRDALLGNFLNEAFSQSFTPETRNHVMRQLEMEFAGAVLETVRKVSVMSEQQIKDFQLMYNILFAQSEKEVIAVDGKMGKQTEAAIKRMQLFLKEQGMYDPNYKGRIDDGKIGKETIKAMTKYFETLKNYNEKLVGYETDINTEIEKGKDGAEAQGYLAQAKEALAARDLKKAAQFMDLVIIELTALGEAEVPFGAKTD